MCTLNISTLKCKNYDPFKNESFNHTVKTRFPSKNETLNYTVKTTVPLKMSL